MEREPSCDPNLLLNSHPKLRRQTTAVVENGPLELAAVTTYPAPLRIAVEAPTGLTTSQASVWRQVRNGVERAALNAFEITFDGRLSAGRKVERTKPVTPST
jgi:hypothetical protein